MKAFEPRLGAIFRSGVVNLVESLYMYRAGTLGTPVEALLTRFGDQQAEVGDLQPANNLTEKSQTQGKSGCTGEASSPMAGIRRGQRPYSPDLERILQRVHNLELLAIRGESSQVFTGVTDWVQYLQEYLPPEIC